jgi:hypothetical protein
MTCAPTATRTRDLPLRRRSLYPLSYRGLRNPKLTGDGARPLPAMTPTTADSGREETQEGDHAKPLAREEHEAARLPDRELTQRTEAVLARRLRRCLDDHRGFAG